jgi:hypothetical protein
MDMKNKNTDELLRAALKSTETPDAALIERVKLAPKPKRGFTKAAIMLAAAFVLTATVFAAGFYLTSFDRLREVVGDEMADMLSPVGVGTLIGEYYSDEIRIEVVAVGVFSNVVDLYITLEDLTGNRFDGEVMAMANVECTSRIGMSASTTPRIIHRDENGVITLHSREFFVQPVSGEMRFALRDIWYNVVIADGTCEEGIFGTVAWDEMNLEWEFTFELEIEESNQRALVAENLNIENFSWSTATLTEVTITPFTVLLEIRGEQTQGIHPRMRIHTTEGIYERTNYCMMLFSSISCYETFEHLGRRILWEIPTDFLDLNTVTAIEVCTNLIEFRECPKYVPCVRMRL